MRSLAEAGGFRPVRLEEFRLDVGRTIVHDFHLEPAGVAAEVTVVAEVPLIDKASATLGHVVSPEIIQDIPLNGRHFVDLTLLVPGSVAPSQAGFSSRPIRGLGTLAFNTAGNREEAASFIVNGVSTNNLTFGSLIFEPPIGSVDEFKADTSVFAAEYGHVSGAVVNIVTRSGSDTVRGDAVRVLPERRARREKLLRVHLDQAAPVQAKPVRRIARRSDLARTDVLLRHLRRRPPPAGRRSQQPRAERRAARERDGPGDPAAAAAHPARQRHHVRGNAAVRRLRPGGRGRRSLDGGRPPQPRRPRPSARVHRPPVPGGRRSRPTQGNSIPGFGSKGHPDSSVLTAGHTHVFQGATTNEIRYGRTHVNGGTFPAAALNPIEFGIGNGVTRAIGLPQMIVAGDLNFGGPGPHPQGRFDTLHVLTDTLHPRARAAHDQDGRRVPALHQRELRRGHGHVQLSLDGRLHAGDGELVQHHARRAAEPHRSARARAVRPGPDRHRQRSPDRSRPSLRVARDPGRAGRSLHRLRPGDGVADPRRRGHPADLPAEQRERRAARRRHVEPAGRRQHGPARRLRARGRSAGHDGGA